MLYVRVPVTVIRWAGRHEYPTAHRKQEFHESAESMVLWIRSERYRWMNFERLVFVEGYTTIQRLNYVLVA